MRENGDRLKEKESRMKTIIRRSTEDIFLGVEGKMGKRSESDD